MKGELIAHLMSRKFPFPNSLIESENKLATPNATTIEKEKLTRSNRVRKRKGKCIRKASAHNS